MNADISPDVPAMEVKLAHLREASAALDDARRTYDRALIEAYRHGATFRDMGEASGTSGGTIHERLGRMGVPKENLRDRRARGGAPPRDPGPNKNTRRKLPPMRDLLNRGMSPDMVAERLGCSPQSVYALRSRYMCGDGRGGWVIDY